MPTMETDPVKGIIERIEEADSFGEVREEGAMGEGFDHLMFVLMTSRTLLRNFKLGIGGGAALDAIRSLGGQIASRVRGKQKIEECGRERRGCKVYSMRDGRGYR